MAIYNACASIETKVVHSSAFPALYYLMLVLSTILIWSTTWIWWRPGICRLNTCVRIHQPPHSQDCEKVSRGLGTRLCILTSHNIVNEWAWDYHLIGEWNMASVISVQKSEHSYVGLMRSITYFMRFVIYSMRLVSYSMKLVSKYLLTAIRGLAGRAQE